MRALWLGIDALHWKLIDHLAAAGRIPNFSAWLAGARRAPCLSSMPPMSPAAWNTVFSGLSPARHGIMDFMRHIPGTYMLSVDLPHYSHGAVWKYLAASGRNTILFNTIFANSTQSSANVKVLMPPARPLRETDSFYRNILDELGFNPNEKRAFLSRRLDNPVLNHRLWKRDEGYRAELLKLLLDSMRDRFQLLTAMLGRPGWDLLISVFTDFDALQHCAFETMDFTAGTARDGDPIGVVAEAFDQEFGALVQRLDSETAVIVNSDHGMTRVSQSMSVNRWLEMSGYLTKRDEPCASPGNSYEIEDFHRYVDWRKTRAYTFGLHGGIRLNLAGREPLGTVRQEDRQSLLLEIKSNLLAWQEQMGQPVFRSIHLGGDISSGEHAGDMPDLVIEFATGTMCDPSLFASGAPLQSRTHNEYSAMHEILGMAAIQGRDITPGDMPQIRIEDLTPIVLRILDAPLPKNLDGIVPEGLPGAGKPDELDFDFGFASPGSSSTGRQAGSEQAQIMCNLAALGYIEALDEERSARPPSPSDQQAQFIADLQTMLQEKEQAVNQLRQQHGVVLEDLYARLAANADELAAAREQLTRSEVSIQELTLQIGKVREELERLGPFEALAQDLAQRLEKTTEERDLLDSESILRHIRRSLRRRFTSRRRDENN